LTELLQLKSGGQGSLPYPVYFVHPNGTQWADVSDPVQPPDPDAIYWRFERSSDIWIVQTYLHLKRRGLDVRLTWQLVPGAINVIMNYDLSSRKLPYRSYVVTCRADTFRSAICNHTIVQNPCNVMSSTDHLVPHWPQPGLIPRDPSRGTRVSTLVYMGNHLNLWSGFRARTFEDALTEIGVSFRVNELPGEFHDYRDCDVLIAVRDLTESDYYAKPASKLVNAWHAGVPALLGPEPAFQALQITPLDYIEIRSPDEALHALKRLQANPELFSQMVENGLNRACEFAVERIARRWYELLAGPIANGFAKWTDRSAIWKSCVRPALFAPKAAQNIFEKRKYFRQRDHGFRPISRRFT
jgi:hypothetical protein